MDFRNDCDPQFINVKEVHHDRGGSSDGVVLEIHVVIENNGESSVNDSSLYCYPVAEFGRERGLFLWDTVTNWEEETKTLRFRFE